jgi:hypothetical protein
LPDVLAAVFSRTRACAISHQLFSAPRFLADMDFAGVLDPCWAASQEMQDKEYQSHNQDNVNKSGGHVKCEEPEQPKNDQNCGEHPKHVFIS